MLERYGGDWMTQLIVKKTIVFSLILGACLGLIWHIPSYTILGLVLTILLFLSSVLIILYMKKNEKHLSFIDTRQGAVIGGIAGFFATLGAFISFSPMAYILYLINHNNYFGSLIHTFINETFWLFCIIVIMTCLIFAFTNSATGMSLAYILKFFEKQPDEENTNIDIEIND